MPRRGLIALIFTIAGLRLIVGYVPPAQAGIGGGRHRITASGQVTVGRS